MRNLPVLCVVVLAGCHFAAGAGSVPTSQPIYPQAAPAEPTAQSTHAQAPHGPPNAQATHAQAQPTHVQGGGAQPTVQPQPAQGAPAPAPEVSDAEVEAFVDEHTAGMRPVGQVYRGRLDRFEPVEVRLRRGRCYAMVVRLAEDAQLNEPGGQRYAFKFLPHDTQFTISAGPGFRGDTAVAVTGCRPENGSYTFRMEQWGREGAPDLGTGQYEMRLYAKRTSEANTRQVAAEREQDIREAEARRARREAEERNEAAAGCNACAARFHGCVGAGRSRGSCAGDYRSCAFQRVGPRYPDYCPHPPN